MPRTARPDDDDLLDPVEAADVAADEPDETDGFTEGSFDADDEDDDALADEADDDALVDDELGDPALEDALEGGALDDDAELDDPVLEEAALVADGTDEPVPPTAALETGTGFDDESIAVVGGDEDLDDDEVDGIRDGEFVCRSCFLAKRETQLADPERMLCRDCA